MMQSGNELSGLALSALERGGDLRSVLELLTRASGIPVVLWNLTGRLILTTRKAAGREAEERLPEWVTDGQITQMYRTGVPIVVETKNSLSRFACAALLCAGTVQGFAAVEFSLPEQRDTALTLAEKAAALYAYFHVPGEQAVGRHDDEEQASFALELLGYDSCGGLVFNLLEQQALSGRGRFHPAYLYALARGDAQKLAQAKAELDRQSDSHYALLMEGELRVLFYGLCPPSPNRMEERSGTRSVALLKQLAQNHSIRWGVSSVFRDLKQRRFYKRQADDELCAGIALGGGESVLLPEHAYAEILTYETVRRMGGATMELSDLKRLGAYDAQNGTAYVQTLEAYLRCRNHLTPAAKELYLDRGTLRYRLQKIQELLGVDLEQPATAALFRMGLQVYQMNRGGPDPLQG